MSDWDDLDGVTPRISNEDAERLLSGTSGIDETHELADLNILFGALRGPSEPAERAGLHSALVAFGAAVVTTQSDTSTARTRPMIKKLLTGKALAAIGAVTLISAGAAAAAGVVPTPFSAPRPSVATSMHVDDANHESDDATDETDATDATPATDENNATDPTDSVETDAADATDNTDGQGPDVNGPARFGLCTAYEARTKHEDTTTTIAATAVAEPVSQTAAGDLPVPFQALSDAAAAAGQTVAEFCADAVPGGSVDAPGKSGNNPSVTAPGKSGNNPSVTAPGKSGNNPSVTAPGKSGNNPSVTAPGKSGNNPPAPGPPTNPGGDHGQPVKPHP